MYVCGNIHGHINFDGHLHVNVNLTLTVNVNVNLNVSANVNVQVTRLPSTLYLLPSTLPFTHFLYFNLFKLVSHNNTCKHTLKYYQQYII